MWATGGAKQSVVVYSRVVDLNIFTGIADKLYQRQTNGYKPQSKKIKSKSKHLDNCVWHAHITKTTCSNVDMH